MNKHLTQCKTLTIAFKYRRSVILVNDNIKAEPNQSNVLAALISEMMNFGYIPTKQLLSQLQHKSTQTIISLYDSLIPLLAESKGADVEYTPMYPNFPKQVMEASDSELYINAALHYLTEGCWLPEYDKNLRTHKFEEITPIKIGVISYKEFDSIFTDILKSSDSISADDKETVECFMNSTTSVCVFPDVIPFKENLCIVAGMFLEAGVDIKPMITNATDILRIATYLSGGDVSLAENTKFKSFKRKERRALVHALDSVINIDDINRHSKKWNKLFHSLHVGEYNTKVRTIASQFRDGLKINTFNSKVEIALADHNVPVAVELLTTRPGDFARRLMHVIGLIPKNDKSMIDSTVNAFIKVADAVSTRVLLQLLGYIKVRAATIHNRVVFPKGNTQKTVIINKTILQLDHDVLSALKIGISDSLLRRFSSLDKLGRVYIDEQLKQCPIPTQQRSASSGCFSVARGTRLPISNKKVLRLFIYWVGKDIDLSATFHDSDFNLTDRVSYSNLREKFSRHSGDVVSAPKGGSEFIDIDIDLALSEGHRFVAMNVLVYNGPSFAEHKTCYAGWMTRDHMDNNEIYDPKTVDSKVDLTGNSRVAIAMVFDLLKRKAVWVDLNIKDRAGFEQWYCPNNVEGNSASIVDIIKSVLFFNNKVSLYDLFSYHAKSRGIIVDNKDEADVSFGFDCDVTPYDITTINANYIVD